MYPAASVVQQFAQDNNNINNDDNANPVASEMATTATESTIQGRGLFRSVVINDIGNIVAFSPPKTINFNNTTDSSVLDPMPIADLFVAEEFVEGTMINLFYNPSTNASTFGRRDGDVSSPSSIPISGWEISTKGVVGGMIVVPKPGGKVGGETYDKPNKNNPAATPADTPAATPAATNDESGIHIHMKSTFRALFLDACIKNGIEFDKLDTRYTYSLVLQHPENPLVCNIPTPSVYLIAVYSVDNETLTVTRHPRSAVDWKSIGFRVPREYASSSSPASAVRKNTTTPVITFKDIRNRYANPTGASPYRIMGVMLHSIDEGTGWSFKLRNPSYESAKHAPLEHGKRLLFEYCSMRRTHEVNSHLKNYPDDATVFSEFNARIRGYTSELFSNYVDCFIHKMKPLLEYDINMRTHMYRMHNDIYKARVSATVGTTGAAATSAAAGTMTGSIITNPKPNPPRCGLKFQDAVQYVNLVMSPIDLYHALTHVSPISTANTDPAEPGK